MLDVYKIITDKIIEKLENGIVPWQKPWLTQEGAPRNFKSGSTYSGINAFHLATEGFGSPNWLTYNQAKEMGGNVKKGEKGTQIIYAGSFMVDADKEKKSDDENKKESKFFLKLYTVFNQDQIEGIEFPTIEPVVFNPIETAETIIQNLPVTMCRVEHSGSRAYYSRIEDKVNVPNKNQFPKAQNYYATLFHELIHATGHKTRLDRFAEDKTYFFGNSDYSKEELVAEMGAAFLCGEAGILNETIDNNSAYINSWLERLKSDKRLVVSAASQASRAANLILNRKDG